MEGARKSKRGGTSGAVVGTVTADGERVKHEAGELDWALGAHASQSTMSKNDESPLTPAKRKVCPRFPHPLSSLPPAAAYRPTANLGALPRETAGGGPFQRITAWEEGGCRGARGGGIRQLALRLLAGAAHQEVCVAGPAGAWCVDAHRPQAPPSQPHLRLLCALPARASLGRRVFDIAAHAGYSSQFLKLARISTAMMERQRSADIHNKAGQREGGFCPV